MHRQSTRSATGESPLIAQLMQPQAHPCPVRFVKKFETHISWVVVTDRYAYKIKKPLDLGFLDCRTLAQRRHYCAEEIRLNQPWAPQIYLDVVPIVMRNGHACIGGEGEPVEYAVRMKSFDQDLLLDRQLLSGALNVADASELGAVIAQRHLMASRTAPEQRAHIVRRAAELVRENFPALAGYVDQPLLDQLQRWTAAHLTALEEGIGQRFDDGFFRACHGDLHLGNLVRLATGITTFDGIEFSDDLRNIDVVADYAFLVMDLVFRRRVDLAAQFLNRYLEVTGDYDGLRFLNLYVSYRCLVRAKVAVLRSVERHEVADRDDDLATATRYCEIAAQQVASRKRRLIIMHGLSGSGKTFVSDRLVRALPAIRIRSDIERKRLFDLDASADTGAAVAGGIYTEATTQTVYDRLFELADSLLRAGHDVVLDAAFLRASLRQSAHALADRVGARFAIVETRAADQTLRRRLHERDQQHVDASEADATVLDYQLQNVEPLIAQEVALTHRCMTESLDIDALVSGLR